MNGTPADDQRTRTDFTWVSGTVGALWTATRPHAWHYRIEHRRARAKTELFARGRHDAPDAVETGDPKLTIELTQSLELTGRYATAQQPRGEYVAQPLRRLVVRLLNIEADAASRAGECERFRTPMAPALRCSRTAPIRNPRALLSHGTA